MRNVQEQSTRESSEARAAAVVYEALAEALLNLPAQSVVADVARVARLLGADGFDAFTADEALEQRFYDRFFVAASPLFVPLNESSVRGGAKEEGRWRFGRTAGERTDHVLACYRAAGFDPRSLAGCELAVGSSRPDSLANELAFMAHLANVEASVETDVQAGRARAWQQRFLEEHLGRWADKAADALAATDDDFYARVVSLAAAWTALDNQRAGA